MLSPKDVSVVYETLLSSPGMNDTVKIALSISRKNVLLLHKVIEAGLSVKEDSGQNGLLSVAGDDSLEQLKSVAEDLLSRAGLVEMNAKLNALQFK
jgi:hypothetical protein